MPTYSTFNIFYIQFLTAYMPPPLPRVRTTRYGLHSLRYAATKLWNDLPNEYRQDMSLDHFKNLMNKWGGEVCKCNFCK